MRQRALRLLALAAICVPLAARAADLDDRAPPYDPYASRYGSPYDDPRYRDMYEHPAPPPRSAAPYRYHGAYPPRSTKDGYLPPMDGPPRFADHASRYAERVDACIPRGEAKRRLIEDGWSDFHDLDIRGHVALVRARRPSGRLFELEVDRCSGEIVRAMPLTRGYSQPYADGRRRHDRYY
jgi:hypothetical protein